jgi:hypothetical protein
MFVGHYAVALAAKRLTPRTSLGLLFLAVQLLDIVWAPLILFGVEHARVVPGLLPASALDLYDMPWTHGLVAAIAWSWFTFRFSKNAVLGGCVMSHWILDFITHRPDLPLFRGGTRVGLGLWRFREVSFLVEVALLIAGVLIYEQATRAKTVAGTYAMRMFAGVMILIEAFNIYGPTPHSIQQVAISAEVAYLVLAAVAWRLDLLREPVERAVEPPISILAS